jgi:hypothetical protein
MKPLTMIFEPTTIQHLGLSLYVSLPPVLGELVSNSWDADAELVEITLPTGSITDQSEVVVRDYGSGMVESEVRSAYLRIGRNRRKETRQELTPKKRPIMGRKGIGKLAAFGVARLIQVRTIRDGQALCFEMDYDQMTKEGARAGSSTTKREYHPSIVTARTGPTAEKDGTEVRIMRLTRKKPIDDGPVRKELARRFTVFGDKFKVLVNQVPISTADRRLRKDCARSWDVDEFGELSSVLNRDPEWRVKGWIGLVESSSVTDRGVDLFVRGKAAEMDSMFGSRTTHLQFARAYIVGEVNAEFLDKGDVDDISTGRNSVHWDTERGEKLQQWGIAALKWVSKEWLEYRHNEKEDKVIKIGNFGEWLKSRTPREQSVARALVRRIVDDENIDLETAGPILEVIKANVEFEAFQDLVDELEGSSAEVKTILKLFQDWRVIEAREALKLSDGRLNVMRKLHELIEKDALEVQEMQPLFEKEGWLVNPSWGRISGQTRYSKMLREKFKEAAKIPDTDRRIDLIGYNPSGSVQVVELKRPGHALRWDDLVQIERYVLWMRDNVGDGVNFVGGTLIVGKASDNGQIKQKRASLAGQGIFLQTYDDLLQQAVNLYDFNESDLKAVAPEYSRAGRRARKGRAKLRK